jgi:hypothetical protein
MVCNVCIGVIINNLETRESNPHSLGPKPNALPVKLAPRKVGTYRVYIGFVCI